MDEGYRTVMVNYSLHRKDTVLSNRYNQLRKPPELSDRALLSRIKG